MAGIFKKLDKLFLLNKKRFIGIIVAWVISVVLHNAIYGLFKDYFDSRGSDEPVFFILAVIVIPLYGVISFFYSAIRISTSKEDLDKGW